MLIHHKKPTKESFIRWINQHPDSSHPLDYSRFLIFVKTGLRQGASKLLDPENFKKEVLRLKPDFDMGILNSCASDLQKFSDLHKTRPIIILEVTPENGHETQIDVIKDQITQLSK